ncbi:MAG: beta-1,6-N-acetylglucosaminyltransferase [Anaerolineales bacterium]|nr:beta-1,6-N-acetylglucosaminyltransferase [Anaerolineales bacterium]
MKIAYIILAHQYPEQLARLILRLNTPNAIFLVHIDKKTGNGLYEQVTGQLSHFANVRFLKRYKSCWGSFGVVQATLEGIKEIVEKNIHCDYIVLLTGQDYPIKSNSHLKEFFNEHQGKSFINHFSLPAPPGWQNGGMDRIEYWHFRFFNRRFFFPPKSNSFIKRPFPQGFKPFGGSAYWALTREAVEYIYNFALEQRKLIEFFKFVDCLMNFSFKQFC